MGLLDDAIREHLELKRRHGADASEVERQEHEALGPARRSAAPATDTAYAEDDLPAGAVDDEDDPDALYDDDEVEYDDEPVAAAPVAEPEAPVAPAERPGASRAPRALRARAVRRRRRGRRRLEPVEEEDLEPPPSADRVAGEEKGEDVLEETPEFLQETPEHDRLWFEQKPPRDFEF